MRFQRAAPYLWPPKVRLSFYGWNRRAAVAVAMSKLETARIDRFTLSAEGVAARPPVMITPEFRVDALPPGFEVVRAADCRHETVVACRCGRHWRAAHG